MWHRIRKWFFRWRTGKDRVAFMRKILGAPTVSPACRHACILTWYQQGDLSRAEARSLLGEQW